MKSFTAKTADPDAIIHELLNGDGAVRLTGLFTPDQIADARGIIMQHSENDTQKATHFQGAAEADGKIALQRRVWNLLAKGDVFSNMAAHPVLMDILRKFLGTEFIMGSIAANRILPAAFVENASADMRQLLGLNYPYPEILDVAKAGNAEGRA